VVDDVPHPAPALSGVEKPDRRIVQVGAGHGITPFDVP
jgi:ferredoxin-NADP reductase